MSNEPVTIEIEPDCINIMNFPGIDRSISSDTIEKGQRFVSRYYRNRRPGEFLKELDLSEGHSSGIPTIQEELERNGSPRAKFFTDEDGRAMRIRIPIHPAFLEDEPKATKDAGDRIKSITPKTEEQYAVILNFMEDRQWHKTSEIMALLSLKETRAKQLMKELTAADKADKLEMSVERLKEQYLKSEPDVDGKRSSDRPSYRPCAPDSSGSEAGF